MNTLAIVIGTELPQNANTALRRAVLGKAVSNKEFLKLHKCDDETYSIIYEPEEFKAIETSTIYNMLKKIYRNYFSGGSLLLNIVCLDGLDCIEEVKKLHELLENNPIENITYAKTRFIGDLYDVDKFDFEDFGKYIKRIKKPKKIKSKDDFSISFPKKSKKVSASKLVLKGKKSIKRHNIIVGSYKNAMRHDVEVIKDFLKEFIPYKDSWARKYRKEILRRWISSFIISNKTARKLQKRQKEKIQVVRKTPDPFYDVNR